MDSPKNSTLHTGGGRTVRDARDDEAPLIRDFQVVMAMESEKLKLDPAITLRGVNRIFNDPALGKYLVMETIGRNGKPEVVGCTLVQNEWRD